MTRRDFIKNGLILWLGIGAGIRSAAGYLSGCARDSTALAPRGSFRIAGNQLIIALPQTPALAAVGGAILIKSALREAILVVHSDATTYQAFPNKCTHRSRPLRYDHQSRVLHCRSLDHSQFGLDGRVLKGPAEKPLATYPTTLEGTELHIDISALI